MISLPTPQQLRYLLALSEQQHFGRAAQVCAVSQSTLSAGMLALERQLDTEILDRRSGKHVLFTAIGRELVERARTALVALEAFAEAASATRAPMSGPLRLGVIPTIGPFLLPRLMPALREGFPQLRLFLREDTTENLMERLRGGRLDVLLLALPCACAGAETLGVVRDEFMVALPAGHPLGARAQIPAQALEHERLLLLEDGHCLRDQALVACGLVKGTSPPGGQDSFAATSLHTLVQMVAGGLGVTLLPRIAIQAGVTAGTDIILRPFAGTGAWRTLGLVWRMNAGRTEIFRALGDALAAAAAA